MKLERFNQILDETLGNMREVMTAKREEYAGDYDVLRNFKESSAMEGNSPEDALRGMLLKHWTSIRDLCRESNPSLAKVEEKLGDAQNYLVLLKALLIERIDNHQ
jgi:RecA/RadA recombinase